MKMIAGLATVFGGVFLAGTLMVHGETWVRNNVDVPNQNLAANSYDADSVKVKDKTLSWTEKFELTGFGEEKYTKHLLQFPGCRENISKNGTVTHHQIDFEIREGRFRTVARRNYTKTNTLICTDREMGTELDTAWHDIVNKSPMSERYYILVTRYKLGNI